MLIESDPCDFNPSSKSVVSPKPGRSILLWFYSQCLASRGWHWSLVTIRLDRDLTLSLKSALTPEFTFLHIRTSQIASASATCREPCQYHSHSSVDVLCTATCFTRMLDVENHRSTVHTYFLIVCFPRHHRFHAAIYTTLWSCGLALRNWEVYLGRR